MANLRNSNTFYIDTEYSTSADDLAVKNIKLTGLVVSATAASAVVVLADAQTGSPKKLDVRVATDGESKELDLSERPIVFPNGIRALTLTNAVVSCTIEENRG